MKSSLLPMLRTATLVAAAVTSAKADSVWLGTTDTNWFQATNWTGSAVPTATDAVFVNETTNRPLITGANADMKNLTIGLAAGAASLEIRNSTSTITETLRLGGSGSGVLTLGVNTTLTSNNAIIGGASGPSGNRAIVAGVSGGVTRWINTIELDVGFNGAGALDITGGGEVSSADVFVGTKNGVSGIVLVSGAGSKLAASGVMHIGRYGNGVITIADGAEVSAASASIGAFRDPVAGTGFGIVNLDGAGSKLTVTGNLKVADAGRGSMNISNGSTVESATGDIGFGAGGDGAVTVGGSGSTWTNTGGLVAGYSGKGVLTVTGGGKVVSNGGEIGVFQGGEGLATITGAGSLWDVGTGFFTIGYQTSGTLLVADGGELRSGNAQLGINSGGVASATVTGADSLWAVTGNLEIARIDRSELIVSAGGKVEVTGNSVLGGFIANGPGEGVASVAGTGSKWVTTGDLTVGNSGNGTLAVTAGGLAEAENIKVGYKTGGTGQVTVDGAGSRLVARNDLTIGGSGTGTLGITGGGEVAVTRDLQIGSYSYDNGAIPPTGAPGYGEVTVSGAGSKLTVGSTIEVGRAYDGSGGSGKLTIGTSAEVTAYRVDIGSGDYSSGTVIVDGAGSKLNTQRFFVSENGFLEINNGGTVTSGDYAYLGSKYSGAGATYGTVTGVGSKWTIAGDFHVAAQSGITSYLNIRAGGVVESDSASIGDDAGSFGYAFVQGADSQWTTATQIIVGDSGSGNLTVGTGGVVRALQGVVVARTAGSAGTLTIGASPIAGSPAPGTLDTPSVTFGDGEGQLLFNHSATDFVFAPVVSGAGRIAVYAGTTKLSAINTYSAGTNIFGGTLIGKADAFGSGDILNRGMLVIDAPIVTTFANKLSGDGTLVKTGDGTLTLSGANTSTGLTRVDAGTLIIADGAASQGGYTTAIGTRLLFAGNPTLAADLAGAGDFDFEGAGTTTLSGTKTGTGTVSVGTGHTLDFDGTPNSPTTTAFSRINIAAGAFLHGSGTFGTLVNSGTVAPGHSPGTITLAGDFVNNGGNVQIELGGTGPGQFDVIRYAGHAIVNGGTLDIVNFGGFAPGDGQVFLFLEDTAPDGATSQTGTGFTTVNVPALAPGLVGSLVSNASGTAFVVFDPATSASIFAGAPIHDGLDYFVGAAAANPALAAALRLEAATGGGAALARAIQNASSIGLSGMDALIVDENRAGADFVRARARATPSAPQGEWSSFVDVHGVDANWDSGRDTGTFNANFYGGRGGLSATVAPGLSVGVAAGYDSGTARLHEGGGKIDQDRGSLTVYGAYDFDGGAFAYAGLTGGVSGFDTRRETVLGRANGSADAIDISLTTGAGYRFDLTSEVSLTPYAAMTYTHAMIDGYSETGGPAALRLDSRETDSLRFKFGSDVSWRIPVGSGAVRLALGLAYEQEALDRETEIRAAFAGGSAFDVKGRTLSTSSLVFGPKIGWDFAPTQSIGIGYDYEYDFSGSESHRFDASYTVRF